MREFTSVTIKRENADLKKKKTAHWALMSKICIRFSSQTKLHITQH